MAVGNVKRKGSRRNMEKKIVRGGLIGMSAWGELVAQRASENAPVDTTHLANSLYAEPPEHLPPFIFMIDVGTNVEYARAQEMGSGLYAEEGPRAKIPIWAGIYTGKSSKESLSFFWPGGPDPHPALQTEGPYAGKYAFAKIMHPGVRPKSYLRNALRDTREEGVSLFLSAVTTELRASV